VTKDNQGELTKVNIPTTPLPAPEITPELAARILEAQRQRAIESAQAEINAVCEKYGVVLACRVIHLGQQTFSEVIVLPR